MQISWKCDCASMSGTIEAQGLKGYRAVCLCDDCQAYAHHLGRAHDILDAHGGTDVFPVTPARLQISQGFENLKCLRLGPHGMYRWYAGCCQSPIANTPASLSMPYMGVVHTIFEKENTPETLNEAFGPIQAYIQGRFGIAPLPPKTSGTVSLGFLFRVIKFVALALFRKERNPHPFFDRSGKPKVAPTILSPQERQRLRAYCGPHPTQKSFS